MCSMPKDFYYKNYSSINTAMQTHNSIMPGETFTLIDYNLLCLAKSFYDSNQQLYMTNEQLAAQFFACEKTIRNSINRLCRFGFLKKEKIFKNRYLVYQPQTVEKFILDMKSEP